MPVWASEGIASLYDDEQRHVRRRDILDRFARGGSWPLLEEVMAAKSIQSDDKEAYSVSESLVRFFLDTGPPSRLLEFVDLGSRDGWPTALRKHYGISGFTQLQREWQSWYVHTRRRSHDDVNNDE